MTRKRHPHSRYLRWVLLGFVVGVALPAPGGIGPASGVEGGGRSSQFQELAPFPLRAGADHTKTARDFSGWLILNTRKRFAYQIFEGGKPNVTVVQSFDLDTLEPRRRIELSGVPIPAGLGESGSPTGTYFGGELVHAVDEKAGRLYLAMSEISVQNIPRQQLALGATDGHRPLARLVMIDEAKLDRGEAAVASFREPVNHAAFHSFYLQGLAVSRHHGEVGRPGKLLATFAHPAWGFADGLPGHPFAHVVTQWDVGDLTAQPGHESLDELRSTPLTNAGDQRVLDVCARSTLASYQGVGEGTLQWELLAGHDALFVVCQAGLNNAAVVEVPLGPGGALTGGAPLQAYPLAKPVADVLVDEERGRLLLRAVESAGNQGVTLWVFDTGERRYTGAVALKQELAAKSSLGLDSATGRLYALVPDQASGTFPVRGGLQITDTRLDPASPLENIRPDLAYPALFRIRVDSATRRVFVRRGHAPSTIRRDYPKIQPDTPSPVEDFYRVFRDRIPVAEQTGDIDDSGFTTDVAEGELTRASYQGDGSGYGARSLVIGGLDAATTQQAVTAAGSPCGKDDREVLAGSVGAVTLSDVTMRAEAAALDADARTRRISPDLVDACRHPSMPATGDTEQLAFDEMGPDVDGDNKPDRTGRNHYAATCLGEPDKAVSADQEGFTASGRKGQKKQGREAFVASVSCDQAASKARGSAIGALSPGLTAAALLSATSASEPVRVAHSSSTVTATRLASGGIEVKVDSVARGIEISNGTAVVATIAVVRAEATSIATGRPGGAGGIGAKGSFTRTICGISVPGNLSIPGCINGKGEQDRTLLGALNQALGTQGRARLRDPDPELSEGSPSGYRAAVQRDRDELFEDASITKDTSSAVPGLELMFFMGDGDARWGSGRQVVHLAGVQASTSYGITCLYGQLGNGRCAKAGESDGTGSGTGTTTTEFVAGETVTETIVEPGGTTTVSVPVKGKGDSRIRTILSAPVRALQQALRLLFNNPRELGLMAAVWALLYAPCYLGERRRSVTALRARRAAIGLGGAA